MYGRNKKKNLLLSKGKKMKYKEIIIEKLLSGKKVRENYKNPLWEKKNEGKTIGKYCSREKKLSVRKKI